MDRVQKETGERLWSLPQEMPAQERLSENLETDVCIVGGGIAGLTTAYLLAREGKQVVVLEGRTLGSGETGLTTAHLSNALDEGYSRLEKIFGKRRTRLVAESHTAAIDRIQTIVREEKIDCDFERVDGYLFLDPEDAKKTLEKELEAAHRAGLEQVQWSSSVPLPFADGPCLLFPRQGQFHPTRYLQGLAAAIVRRGGKIFTQAQVERVKGGRKPRVVTAEGHKVRAEAVVLATNTPINDLLDIHTRQHAYRSYVVVYRIAKGSIPLALYWDTADPYHYIRLQPHSDEEDYLIVGGADHRTGQGNPKKAFAQLHKWVQRNFPQARETDLRWSGQVMEPVDSLAFIGRDPGNETNVYIATGDSGDGMTHGTIAGMLLTDLILDRDNPWAEVYDPSRSSLKAIGSMVSENVQSTIGYLDWVIPGSFSTAEDVSPGEGTVVQRGLRKVALCREENGEVHELSAVCPHLGCVVQWNKAEKTWDCPCHGSRFNSDGSVINGPAVKDLRQA